MIAPDTGDRLWVTGAFTDPHGVIMTVTNFGWYESPTRWWRFKRWLREHV